MADKRMLARTITESDKFNNMPHSARVLYIGLVMAADDEGFVNSVSGVLSITKTTKSDLDILRNNGYIIHFKSGSLVIVEWFVHNTPQSDRKKLSLHLEAKYIERLENKTYALLDTALDTVVDTGAFTVVEHSIEENREKSIEENREKSIGEIKGDKGESKKNIKNKNIDIEKPNPTPTKATNENKNKEGKKDGDGFKHIPGYGYYI